METAQRALYLFCFARSNLIGELQGTGVDGQHPLSLFRRFPDLCAVLSEVPLEDFCGDAAELRMQDLAWVGPRALRHEAVVEEVMRHSPVLPARFGTLFSSQERLAEFLDKHRGAISEFLERVADQAEWSVRGLLDRRQAGQALTSASLAAREGQLAALPAGRRYFEEQRIRAGAEKELSLWLNETRRQVASDLMKQASDFCESLGGASRGPRKRNRGCAELGLFAAQECERDISRANRSGEREPCNEGPGPRTVRALAPLSLRSSSINGSVAMSYLLYCIFHCPLPADLEIPAGVGGQRVFTANYKGFGAVLSNLAEPDSPPDISAILAYETVVESFHCHLTVIPLRYGSRVECPYEAIGLLRKNQDAYRALLHELEGLAEMGIQLLLDNSGAGTESNPWPVPPRSIPLFCASGAGYLAAKRQRYLGVDRAALHQRRLVEEVCGSLADFFVRRKEEIPEWSRTQLLSLYFLVPRDSVESFRRAACHLRPQEPVKLLLSGPWPPYNFVDSLER